MLDVIFFIIIITAVMSIIYFGTKFVLNILFGGRDRNWVEKHFKNHSGVDLEKVNRLVEDPANPTEGFTHWEIAAYFGSLLLEKDVAAVLRIADKFGQQSWEGKFNYDFYTVLEQTAQTISLKGENKDARKLLMFGLRLAEFYQEKAWVERFWKLLDLGHSSGTEME
jgi:hypothetical protein